MLCLTDRFHVQLAPLSRSQVGNRMAVAAAIFFGPEDDAFRGYLEI
jgi:hypothetical protein